VKIEALPIGSLRPAPYNPRIFSDDNMRKLEKSLREFGIVEPIVINQDNTVIGGHQRLRALEKLGKAEVPCVRVNLNKTKEKALNLALNKIVGEFDSPKLKDVLEEIDTGELEDIEISGFDEGEIENLMTQFYPASEEEQPRPDERTPIKCPKCGHEFTP